MAAYNLHHKIKFHHSDILGFSLLIYTLHIISILLAYQVFKIYKTYKTNNSEKILSKLMENIIVKDTLGTLGINIPAKAHQLVICITEVVRDPCGPL